MFVSPEGAQRLVRDRPEQLSISLSTLRGLLSELGIPLDAGGIRVAFSELHRGARGGVGTKLGPMERLNDMGLLTGGTPPWCPSNAPSSLLPTPTHRRAPKIPSGINRARISQPGISRATISQRAISAAGGGIAARPTSVGVLHAPPRYAPAPVWSGGPPGGQLGGQPGGEPRTAWSEELRPVTLATLRDGIKMGALQGKSVLSIGFS